MFEGLARYEILDLFYCTHNLLWKQDVCRSLGVYTELVYSVNPTFPHFLLLCILLHF